MKLPRIAVVLGGLLPPAACANHVKTPVGVDIAYAQTVREPLRARNLFAWAARPTDGVHFPQRGGVFARPKPRHLSLILRRLHAEAVGRPLRQLGNGLPTHDQNP